MQFSIITPSFRNSNWLKLCIPSVADQAIDLEHIVQDAVSDDGTLDWLPHDPRVKPFIEKDQGMYDAVNRGLRKAKGEILAYLNCDEQYLPGALQTVWEFFQAHPKIELVFTDAVVINRDFSFNCFRKVQLPWECHIRTIALCTLTCSMFFRRSLIDDRKLFFSDAWRELGDADWVVRALRAGLKMRVLRRYTSVFTETGHNAGLRPNSQVEKRKFEAAAPFWVRHSRPLIDIAYKTTRLLSGGLHQKPFSYSIYTTASPTQRVTFQVDKPTPYWIRTPLQDSHAPA